MKTFYFAVQPWYNKPQTTRTPPSPLKHSSSNITSVIKGIPREDILVTLPNNLSTFTAAMTSSYSVS